MSEILQVYWIQFDSGDVALVIPQEPYDEKGYPFEEKIFADRFSYKGEDHVRRTFRIEVKEEICKA